MPDDRSSLVAWAKQTHKQLGERIKKGKATKGEKATALINDLKWRQSVLNSIITMTASWGAPQLAAMASRLCVRMPVEFFDQSIYELANQKDIKARDDLLSRIGEVALDSPAAKQQLYPLLQEAATFAFDGHEWAYKAWFAKAA